MLHLAPRGGDGIGLVSVKFGDEIILGEGFY
jgi:hypothetical protein